MTDEEREQLTVELAAIDEYLASTDVFETLDRVQGFHSMARLTTSNLAAFEAHLTPLADPAFAKQLLDAPTAPLSLQYVERLQHLAANYFLSAVPLLEHIKLHVEAHYPDPAHRTRVQYERGLDIAINRYSGHAVVIQLRHFVVHRALPRITMFPGANWFEGKSIDRGAPFGPVIVPKEFIPNYEDLHLVTKVNGEVMQDDYPRSMIWKEPQMVSYLSEILTLYPGDVISTGTPAGTGMERQKFLKADDVVSIEIEKIGTLTTHIQAWPAKGTK